MTLGLLWLGLPLLGALQTQAQNSTPTLIPPIPLHIGPMEPEFQDDQFQGKWYVLGVAENTIQNGNQLSMYSTTFELNDADHSYNVTTALIREDLCENQTYTFVPGVHRSQYTLSNTTWPTGTQSYTMRVVATNYKQFAVVFSEKTFEDTVYFKTIVYGRTKELSPELKERFVNFVKSVGFTEDNIIFTDPIDECI
ncbi:Neutrophil gelatinase-associated lipocalin [Heterocephalus glaber]|uniref:Neutrophil gelatinase-associated lipocalin n=1 Tax=Heterocephalus glaber TaxID=10181 RepID=G5ASF7_HETGA|nr:Neutrophil gelatinase-associated lipocalin [Heterocephalus glaber]